MCNHTYTKYLGIQYDPYGEDKLMLNCTNKKCHTTLHTEYFVCDHCKFERPINELSGHDKNNKSVCIICDTRMKYLGIGE